MVEKVFEVSLEDKQGRWLESKTPPRVQGRTTMKWFRSLLSRWAL